MFRGLCFSVLSISHIFLRNLHRWGIQGQYELLCALRLRSELLSPNLAEHLESLCDLATRSNWHGHTGGDDGKALEMRRKLVAARNTTLRLA